MLLGPKSLWLVAVALLLGSLPVIAQSPKPETSRNNLSLDEIVTRMEVARVRNKQMPPFLLTREYKMFHGDEARPESQVKAEINVVPPHQRDYRIVESSGNDRGEKVVRKILDHEATVEKSDHSATALVRENYEFADLGRETFKGVNCYVLGLKARREETGLLNGRAWIDPKTFDILKMEGTLAKSPSWWVKDVNVVVNFGQMAGVWTQISSDAMANVRMLGRYTIQGRALNIQTGDALAMNARPRRPTERYHNGVPATFIYGTRR